MKYNYFQDEKLKYEDIEIPDELLLMVRQTVAADRKKKAAAKYYGMLKMAGSVAALLFLCLTIGVNTSYAFAETAVKIPIVKNVAKAVVVRSYRPEILAVYEENKKSKVSKEDPTGEEPLPEETVPTVSDNDVISESEMPQQPEEKEPEEILEGIDAWKAEMTPEKLKEITELYTSDMEKKYEDTPEKLRTILLASLPKKDIALYGYHEDGKTTGVALRVKDDYRYYDWNYMNSSKKLPELSCADVDGDGEEEIVVFLYNGEAGKKKISKEDIVEPGTAASDDANEAANPDKTDADTEGTADSTPADTEQSTTGSSGQTGTETDNIENTGESDQSGESDSAEAVSGGDMEEMPDVSGNNVAKPTKKPAQIAGEIWVVDPKGENWSASVLSVNDYESQILHRLKAAYDEKKGTVQLYLSEEPFGEPVKLSVKNPTALTYEAINLAAQRDFVTKRGLSLQFQMEAIFLNEENERKQFPINLDLKAEICLEDDTLTVESIELQ
ncbi:MAG: hypothetical protein HDQ96_08740 [Lachnospiraceae bacterium]|nr:hypothetical protein [Lachnospiraceae bacterium]